MARSQRTLRNAGLAPLAFRRGLSVLLGLVALGACAGCGSGAPEGTLLAEDLGASPNPLPFWGRIDCDRHESGLTPPHLLLDGSGDPHPTASGAPQGNDSFRRLTVYDGDDVSGERCELGFNDQGGPTALYTEGSRRITFASIRLPAGTDVGDPRWRVVLQMKQAQPYNNPNPASVFEVEQRSGHWFIGSDWDKVWQTPAQANVWTRFVFDITYSRDPEVGSIQVSADVNGDGDFEDDVNGDGRADEVSPVVHRATLVTETPSKHPYRVPAGGSIPSHLRAGIYQDAAHPCPRDGAGCSVDVDNVQIIALPRD